MMRQSPLQFVLALAKARLAQRPSADAEEWKPLSTAATDRMTAPEVYYSPEELERRRENSRRATEQATAYITAELGKAKGRSERRDKRP
ncbi:hypothetical protein [Mesorhizobium sp. M6A.T.Cr.TU.016.01.1.1]|uniref:hypothetical protein n=1 Tax=Mesorhizobium sp. M6A.T.Cr.TU.016.01.1.1 TaxID=2493677 RepID=UPI000F75AEEF|nr:hypothetical protein [Mesorhizobium sp. M6A.T.Cr.TU.016.01.1.1]AZO68013.1 hypothetical protein EJ075_25915 [Mesorhizobium sp. M6A.T.Cr.TU.016.01.1.1]